MFKLKDIEKKPLLIVKLLLWLMIGSVLSSILMNVFPVLLIIGHFLKLTINLTLSAIIIYRHIKQYRVKPTRNNKPKQNA